MRILPYTKDFNKERHKNKFHLICLTKEEDKNNIVTLKLWLSINVLRGLPDNQVDLFE